MTRQPPWNDAENGRCVRLYFEMVDAVEAGEKYVKAQMIRDAQCLDGCHQELAARSRTSIEFKLMNCTAIHQALRPEAVTMHDHGYRAMPNYQAELKEAMLREITARELTEMAVTGIENRA